MSILLFLVCVHLEHACVCFMSRLQLYTDDVDCVNCSYAGELKRKLAEEGSLDFVERRTAPLQSCYAPALFARLRQAGDWVSAMSLLLLSCSALKSLLLFCFCRACCLVCSSLVGGIFQVKCPFFVLRACLPGVCFCVNTGKWKGEGVEFIVSLVPEQIDWQSTAYDILRGKLDRTHGPRGTSVASRFTESARHPPHDTAAPV